jgi:hypothetical protein
VVSGDDPAMIWGGEEMHEAMMGGGQE